MGHQNVRAVGDKGCDRIHKEKKVLRVKILFYSPRNERGIAWRDTPAKVNFVLIVIYT